MTIKHDQYSKTPIDCLNRGWYNSCVPVTMQAVVCTARADDDPLYFIPLLLGTAAAPKLLHSQLITQEKTGIALVAIL